MQSKHTRNDLSIPARGDSPGHRATEPLSMTPKIFILMAAYNGGSYIRQQIESIEAQDYNNWRLLIRDDGSTDDTVRIIREASEGDERIKVIIKPTEGPSAPIHNFSVLMEEALKRKAEYCMFADQDDVWCSEKVRLQVNLMLEMEKKYGAKTPLLVYSEMEVVDDRLSVIHPSFMKHQRIKNETTRPLNVLLTQNFVTGCTSLINRRLLGLATPIPKGVMIHDWWVALLAAANGQIVYIDDPMVLYRQHTNNTVGTEGLKTLLNPFRTDWSEKWRTAKENFLGTFRQADLLKERLQQSSHRSDPSTNQLIERYCRIPFYRSRFSRLRQFKQLDLFCQSRARLTLLLLWLFLMKHQPKEGD